MALDWTQIAMVASAFGASFGASVGLPIANALRRPGIERAMQKTAEPLREQNQEQAQEIASLKAETATCRRENEDLKRALAEAVRRIDFLERLAAREPPPPSPTTEGL